MSHEITAFAPINTIDTERWEVSFESTYLNFAREIARHIAKKVFTELHASSLAAYKDAEFEFKTHCFTFNILAKEDAIRLRRMVPTTNLLSPFTEWFKMFIDLGANLDTKTGFYINKKMYLIQQKTYEYLVNIFDQIHRQIGSERFVKSELSSFSFRVLTPEELNVKQNIQLPWSYFDGSALTAALVNIIQTKAKEANRDFKVEISRDFNVAGSKQDKLDIEIITYAATPTKPSKL